MKYETVIGLEIHVELSTKTKIFCSCKTDFGSPQNTQICPVCSGMPGALPVLNREVLVRAVRAGLAFGCEIKKETRFDRKNYFYPDLPKAYQISQLYAPLCTGGHLEIKCGGGKKAVRIGEIHMEEDAGKLFHDPFDKLTSADFNRCGVPLIEIVTQPDMRSDAEAASFIETLRLTLLHLGVSDCRMQEGSLRADLNISVMPEKSDKFGTRVEIKNLNSIKAVRRAVLYETQRQIEILESGGEVEMQTRKWDDNRDATFAMRSKEKAQDYRYFPEPDLPVIVLSDDFISEIKETQPDLPEKLASKYSALGLAEHEITGLTANPQYVRLFERMTALGTQPKRAANMLLEDVAACLNASGGRADIENLQAERLFETAELFGQKRINRAAVRRIITAFFKEDTEPLLFARENDLLTGAGQDEIEAAVASVVAQNAEAVNGYRTGGKKIYAFLMGKCMAELRGRADPLALDVALKKALNAE